jgi:hypothetical protein
MIFLERKETSSQFKVPGRKPPFAAGRAAPAAHALLTGAVPSIPTVKSTMELK